MVIDLLERDDLLFPRSLPKFQRMFPNEATCAAYLERARWADGFVCDHCGVRLGDQAETLQPAPPRANATLQNCSRTLRNLA